MKTIFRLIGYALVLSISVPSITSAQGYRFDKNKTAPIIREPQESMGFAGNLPSSYSLRKWAPTPGLQEGNSCTGWALAYAAMSITFNKAMNITDPGLKDLVAFDPVFTYAMAREKGEPNCDQGVYFPDVIVQMLRYGCKRMIMPPVFLDCDESVYEYTDAFSSAFIPNEIYALDLQKLGNNSNQIKGIKSMLAAGIPLPFGLDAPKSLLGDGKSNPIPGGVWTPTKNDELMGGHAMCVVGYSDTQFGGAFEIMNSWGGDFGNKGFFWIKYNDFIARVTELLYIEPVELKDTPCKIGDCSMGYSHIRLSDGNRYEGLMENGRPEGYGIFIWTDKDFYAGGWSNGKREGKGLFFTGDQVFKCLFENNELIASEPARFADQAGSKNDVNTKVSTHLQKHNHTLVEVVPAETLIKLEQLPINTEWK